jgi:hypothetical protein
LVERDEASPFYILSLGQERKTQGGKNTERKEKESRGARELNCRSSQQERFCSSQAIRVRIWIPIIASGTHSAWDEGILLARSSPFKLQTIRLSPAITELH